MKRIMIPISGTILTVLACVYVAIFPQSCTMTHDNDQEKNYCGPVISKGYEQPTSGYKSKQDAVYFVIILDDQCKKHIRVNVTVPTYYEAKDGKSMCFTLSKWNMRNYGNSNGEHLK